MAERPFVDAKKCIGCGTCAEVCPVNVFEIKSGKSIVMRPQDCVQCRACERSCSTKAIAVK
jgi:NAD-dependent dihydropyrimidine dehydrogenase PreA subunit